jgi:hypothetical protein
MVPSLFWSLVVALLLEGALVREGVGGEGDGQMRLWEMSVL